jgi:hypothetical protein
MQSNPKKELRNNLTIPSICAIFYGKTNKQVDHPSWQLDFLGKKVLGKWKSCASQYVY